MHLDFLFQKLCLFLLRKSKGAIDKDEIQTKQDELNTLQKRKKLSRIKRNRQKKDNK